MRSHPGRSADPKGHAAEFSLRATKTQDAGLFIRSSGARSGTGALHQPFARRTPSGTVRRCQPGLQFIGWPYREGDVEALEWPTCTESSRLFTTTVHLTVGPSTGRRATIERWTMTTRPKL